MDAMQAMVNELGTILYPDQAHCQQMVLHCRKRQRQPLKVPPTFPTTPTVQRPQLNMPWSKRRIDKK